MLALLFSMLKRLITAISSPFRMMIVRIQRLFNINIISAKLIQPLTKNVKKLMRLRPSDKSDYIKVGRFLVFRQLIRLLILAACAGVFIYFQMFAGRMEEVPVSLTGIKTDITFRYDDIGIKDFSGTANIRSFDGGIVYTGEIDRGVCKGNGLLYARDGSLVYEGSFDNNRYNGYGVKYNPGGTVEYEGEFSDNLYHGTGKLYNVKGGLIYSGGFAAGLYEGNGMLYDENGGLVYEGTFSAGKSHGTGMQYYPDGMPNYRGEFFDGRFHGNGELYDKSGRIIYTGAMREGKINYYALVGATLADVEAAFSETPSIFYQEDGNSCYFYEKAGVAITTDCRLKVHEWEREQENPSDGYYYMPEAASTPEAANEYPEYEYYEPAEEIPFEGEMPQEVFSMLTAKPGSLVATPLSWVVIDPYNPSTEEESSSQSSSSSSSSESSEPYEPSGENSYESAPSSSAAETSKPDGGSGAGGLPDFVNKTKQLYFEIDKDVWQPEQELDKTKVFAKRVTVLESMLPPESGVTPIEDNGPPTVEDCVAIDFIRRQYPTAFANVTYEMDKQNKLFQRVWSISHADRVIRRAFSADGVTYRFCYQPENDEIPDYYSIEAQ